MDHTTADRKNAEGHLNATIAIRNMKTNSKTKKPRTDNGSEELAPSPKRTALNRIRKLRGSLKDLGVLKSLMDERNRARG
jgi:hypothetical protein